jgi:hypothetical protein
MVLGFGLKTFLMNQKQRHETQCTVTPPQRSPKQHSFRSVVSGSGIRTSFNRTMPPARWMCRITAHCSCMKQPTRKTCDGHIWALSSASLKSCLLFQDFYSVAGIRIDTQTRMRGLQSCTHFRASAAVGCVCGSGTFCLSEVQHMACLDTDTYTKVRPQRRPA